MKKIDLKQKNSFLVILSFILSVLLVISLIFGIGEKTKTVYIPVPNGANSNFSGEILARYDLLCFKSGLSDITINFDLELSPYDFVVLDILNGELIPDESCSDCLTLSFDEDEFEFENTIRGYVSTDFSTGVAGYSSPYFNFSAVESDSIYDYTYVLDLRDHKNNKITIYCYLNGEFSTKNEFDESLSVLSSLRYSFLMSHSVGFEGLYLYGFENAAECDIGAYLEDTTLNLTNCKDSLLYMSE